MTAGTVPLLASVQRFLGRQHGLYINGGWRPSTSSQTLTVFNPANGQPIAVTPDASAEDVDQAVQSAHRAFVSGVWARRAPAERERILLRYADLLEQHGEELAQLETLEQGKSINIARAFEVGSTLNWMRYTAYTRKEPVGVVAGIVPWNFPLMIGMWKVMPALAAGCSIVIKPSEITPLTLMRMAELATEAGIPDGVFNLITGSGSVCGSALTSHPRVAKISFTGSTATGKHIARSAVDRLTRLSLELGGKNPAIVLADADPQQVIEGLMMGSFLNQGQVCAASSRIYVEAPLFDRLAADFEQAIKGLSVGPGLDPSAQINALASGAHQQSVQAYLADAREQGAQIISGASAPDANGYYVSPSLILNPDDNLRLTRSEVFGPVLSLTRVADVEEALARANDSDYGLTASLWTTSLKSAMDLTPRIEAGTVWVNSHTLIDANMPFGGFKQSGTGRDFGVDWLDAFTETKSVCIRH